jgi:hypothetical protein
MGVVVSFDYAAWQARYPEFSSIDQGAATAYFNEAQLYHRNDGGGPVSNASIQSTLLNMLTAHICKLNALLADQPSPQIVGRISNAAEGSVSVQLENEYPPGTPQWFQQTKYGAAYWAATAQYRTMRYLPGPRRVFDPWPFLRP